MANSALFMGWNRPVTGREKQAWILFGKALEYYTQLQNDGKIESFEPVSINSHGGELNGFILIRGDDAKLDDIRREDTFINYAIEGNYCLENFGIIKCAIGETMMKQYAQWEKLFS